MYRKPYHFPGITAFVPDKLNVIPVEEKIPDRIVTDTEEFTMIRLVGNIAFYDPKDIDHARPIKTFDPPIELRIGYNIEDLLKNHCDLDSLKLAYWDGSNWIIISDPAYNYHILPPSTGQVAEVTISKWIGDPPIGWGR
jgi:hypothetical protein